jgi:uncharacterized membrane protein YeaQ/YmgE (transglycosylase-associated protein family)
MSLEGLVIILIVGLVAGWLASLIVRGGGMGTLGDLLVGLIGALIGSWLVPRFHIGLGSGLVAEILSATLGAIVLLIILRLLFGLRGGRWRRPFR